VENLDSLVHRATHILRHRFPNCIEVRLFGSALHSRSPADIDLLGITRGCQRRYDLVTIENIRIEMDLLPEEYIRNYANYYWWWPDNLELELSRLVHNQVIWVASSEHSPLTVIPEIYEACRLYLIIHRLGFAMWHSGKIDSLVKTPLAN